MVVIAPNKGWTRSSKRVIRNSTLPSVDDPANLTTPRQRPRKKKTIIVRFEPKWFFPLRFPFPPTSPRPTNPMTASSISCHLAIRRGANNTTPKRDLTEIKIKFFARRVLSKRFLFAHTKSFNHPHTHSHA